MNTRADHPSAPSREQLRAIGYVGASREDAESVAVLEAQREAIQVLSEFRGWTLIAIYQVVCGTSMNRPVGLEAAIASIQRGQADVLVAARLDRASPSFRRLRSLREARPFEWEVVAPEQGVVAIPPVGEMVFRVSVSALDCRSLFRGRSVSVPGTVLTSGEGSRAI